MISVTANSKDRPSASSLRDGALRRTVATSHDEAGEKKSWTSIVSGEWQVHSWIVVAESM